MRNQIFGFLKWQWARFTRGDKIAASMLVILPAFMIVCALNGIPWSVILLGAVVIVILSVIISQIFSTILRQWNSYQKEADRIVNRLRR